MAMARQNIAAPLTINLQNHQKVNPSHLRQLVRLGESQLQQFWWHSHAYGTIFGVMLLTVVSFIFLAIHWFYRRLSLTPPS
ncbi:hypothetical protein NIES4074_10610 [Cylindrospermum sp. NIES-4074]|nr:hypothetical protein NIES4074_10610 [Cylindrospermum sp. NIES-4074]